MSERNIGGIFIPRRNRFEAAQGAAIEILRETPGPWQERARVIWEKRFQAIHRPRTSEPPPVAEYLETATFFSELRHRPALREALWPSPAGADALAEFSRRELLAQLLGRVARLGHAFIDFYILLMNRLGSFDLRTQEEGTEDASNESSLIAAYLDLLEQQQQQENGGERLWRAYQELHQVALHLDLIVQMNLPEAPTATVAEIPHLLGERLGEQQPVGGMSGQVSQTLVRQFRMPGYPLVLVTTDLLQEGEDLHTFCSDVYHYGISWTPSAMEQRVGRIDRVRSLTERRLAGAEAVARDEDLLQVYFPHLEDTVEALQVKRVLERMNTFLRLMHEGLAVAPREERHLDVSREMTQGGRSIERIRERLRSAFPVDPAMLRGKRPRLAVTHSVASDAVARFRRLIGLEPPGLRVAWEPSRDDRSGVLLGTAHLTTRQQPFGLYLRTFDDRLVVRCISPVGQVGPAERADEIKRTARELGARIVAIAGENRTYDLSVEEDVLLGPAAADGDRVAAILRRVVETADAIEKEYLGTDHDLDVFREDLGDEQVHREG